MRGEDTADTRSHHLPGAQLWVGLARTGRSSREGFSTGRHEKAPACCPSIQLAALHGATRTQELLLPGSAKDCRELCVWANATCHR